MMDAPARVLSWIDTEVIDVLPPWVRVVLWGGLAALVSMELYRALSPQERIRAVESDMRGMRARLDAAQDGTFQEGWTVVRQMMRLSFRRIALVTPAAIIAWLPPLLLVIWMSGAYQGERILRLGGPSWVGGWELPFFISLSVVALAIKSLRGIA